MSFEYHAKCRHHFLWRKADIVMETSMSANDPKRTSSLVKFPQFQSDVGPALGLDHEPTVPIPLRRRSQRMCQQIPDKNKGRRRRRRPPRGEIHGADLTGPPNSQTENLAPAGRHHSPKFLLYGGCIDFAKPKPRISRDNSGDRNFYGKTRD
jgi:hypothetical protein